MTREHKTGWIGIAGAVLAVSIGFLADLIPLSGMVTSVLFVLFMSTALVTGILGRKTIQGKIAIGISALILLFWLNELSCGWFRQRHHKEFMMRNQELINRAESERQLSNKPPQGSSRKLAP